MGAGDAPYLYDPPNRRQIAYPYSDFDPKAVTRASWISAAESTISKPKQEGPLIDFNRHPDSYMVVAPQVHHEPLPPSTKTKVVATRWVQFGFRLAQLVGAIGCLLCVIFVRNTETAQGWIMRIPPAWDACITTYGVYHLACPARRRTPASSASYHIFGMIMDSGLIPFYIYTAWFAHQNWIAPPDNENRWKNIFNHKLASTDQLLFATFLTPTVVGGLHLVSLGLGFYLARLFRKIANLPPDMNPLEDNLTSRKHQHKNSEASAAFMMQKPGYMSGSTLNVTGSRYSKSMHEDRTVEFRHSRMGSDFDYSPHNPQSAQLSRQMEEERNFCHDLVQRPGTASRSRKSFAQTPNGEPVNQERRDMDSFSFVGDLAAAPAPPPHTSQERSHSPRPGSSVSVRDHAAEQAHYAPTRGHMQTQQQESLLNDNWFVHEDPKSGDLGVPLSPPSPSQRRTPNFSRPSPVGSPDIDRAARFSPMLSPITANNRAQFMPEPLRMNPPTPPNDDGPLQEPLLHSNFQHQPRHDSFQDTTQQTYEKYSTHDDDDDTSTIRGHEDRQPLNEVAVNRSHTNASAQSSQFAGSSVYSESAPSLRTANQRSVPNFQENLNVKSVGTPKKRQYGDLASAQQGIRHHDQPPSPPKHSPYARVVSRTGADIADESLYVPDNTSRRRYVSGKAAEEGMAGGRW